MFAPRLFCIQQNRYQSWQLLLRCSSDLPKDKEPEVVSFNNMVVSLKGFLHIPPNDNIAYSTLIPLESSLYPDPHRTLIPAREEWLNYIHLK